MSTESPKNITSKELIERTGGNPGPADTTFPPEMRQREQQESASEDSPSTKFPLPLDSEKTLLEKATEFGAGLAASANAHDARRFKPSNPPSVNQRRQLARMIESIDCLWHLLRIATQAFHPTVYIPVDSIPALREYTNSELHSDEVSQPFPLSQAEFLQLHHFYCYLSGRSLVTEDAWRVVMESLKTRIFEIDIHVNTTHHSLFGVPLHDITPSTSFNEESIRKLKIDEPLNVFLFFYIWDAIRLVKERRAPGEQMSRFSPIFISPSVIQLLLEHYSPLIQIIRFMRLQGVDLYESTWNSFMNFKAIITEAAKEQAKKG